MPSAAGGTAPQPDQVPDADLAIPIPILNALDKVPDKDAKALLSLAVSKTTFGFGPDPETAKIIAQAEMHEEECRLKAFRSSLQNRELQGQRDHEFRKQKLNHQSLQTVLVLTITIAGISVGLWLSTTGAKEIGNPVLVASFTLLSGLAGKLLSSRDKD